MGWTPAPALAKDGGPGGRAAPAYPAGVGREVDDDVLPGCNLRTGLGAAQVIFGKLGDEDVSRVRSPPDELPDDRLSEEPRPAGDENFFALEDTQLNAGDVLKTFYQGHY